MTDSRALNRPGETLQTETQPFPASEDPVRGRLLLMPNTLDLGYAQADAASLQAVLPALVVQQASQTLHWVAENPKSTRAFLKRVDALCPLQQPLQQLNIRPLPRMGKGGAARAVPQAEWDELLAPTRAGQDVALQSEAGLPAVADPGGLLVRAAHQAGIVVVPLVGPSSLLMALSASGLTGQSFAFVGYLPVDAVQRTRRLKALEQRARAEGQTQVFIETPYRNATLLAAALDTLSPETILCVAGALTWPAQQIHSATIAQWRQQPAMLPLDLPCVFVLGAADTRLS